MYVEVVLFVKLNAQLDIFEYFKSGVWNILCGRDHFSC